MGRKTHERQHNHSQHASDTHPFHAHLTNDMDLPVLNDAHASHVAFHAHLANQIRWLLVGFGGVIFLSFSLNVLSGMDSISAAFCRLPSLASKAL